MEVKQCHQDLNLNLYHWIWLLFFTSSKFVALNFEMLMNFMYMNTYDFFFPFWFFLTKENNRHPTDLFDWHNDTSFTRDLASITNTVEASLFRDWTYLQSQEYIQLNPERVDRPLTLKSTPQILKENTTITPHSTQATLSISLLRVRVRINWEEWWSDGGRHLLALRQW